MKRALVGLTMLIAISSCGPTSGARSHDIYDAQAAVRDKLTDPGSARFRDDRVIGSFAGRYVCGEVDSRNAFGRYSGFQHYLFVPELEKVRIMPASADRLKSPWGSLDLLRGCQA